MPINRYQKANKFLSMVAEKYGNRVSFKDFEREAMIMLGDDRERTLKPYFRLMINTGLIKEEKNAVWITI